MTGVRDLDHLGVKWMGALPAAWPAHPLKRHFGVQLGKMLQNQGAGADDHKVPYLKAQHVQWGQVATDDLPEMWASPSEIRQYGVRSGDLLVCEGGEAGRAGIIGTPPPNCIIQNALHRVRPRDSSDARFLLYVLHAVSASGWFDVLCNRATIAHFTSEKLSELRIPLPPLKEQRAIAARLDRETARIDALLEKKQRQIELIEERRAALLCRIITRGLNPQATLVESQIEWIGSIPEHWAMSRLGFQFSIGNGSTPARTNADYWDEGSIPWLTSGKVHESVIETADEFITKTAFNECHLPLVPGGSVLVAITGEGKTRGTCALLQFEAAISQHLAYLTPKQNGKLTPEFAALLLKAAYPVLRAESSGEGGTKAAITCEYLKAFRIPIPPRDEQAELVASYFAASKRDESLLRRLATSIQTLREYRTALISATVTGNTRIGNQELLNLQRAIGDSDLTVGQSVAHALKEPR